MTKDLKGSLAWGMGIILLALAASYARGNGLINQDVTQRIVFGAIGLMVAWFGNRIPKDFVKDARARQAKRVAGWSMATSGLAYAGLWVFASTDVAIWGGCGAILLGMTVTYLYCVSLRNQSPA